ncbi:MAG: putative Zn-dependent protease [Cognaticolwellia sp.]|jgi:predicted Zn-dependent protease
MRPVDRKTPPNSAADPSLLDGAVAHLQDKGDVQGVIRVVERWARSGEPSDEAVLNQASAFLSLNLMDRAWVRLKEVSQRSPESRRAQLLTAQMFIERGWPLRARKLLEKLGEQDARSEALMVLARQPGLQPPKDARRIEAEGSPAQKLAMAERLMAAGTFLRAKPVLERLHRAGGEPAARAEDLLWGLAGGFVNEAGDPLDLLRTRAPELFSIDEANTLSATLDEEDGYGGEVTSAGLATEEDAGGSDEGFPALFRRADAGPLSPISDEVTAVSKLASPGELARRDPTEDTDHGPGGPLISGDTQIMMVIRKDGQADSGEHHVLKEEDDSLRETLNLRDYLSHMGVDPALSDLGKSDLDLDDDDEDLIVVTKRDRVEREHTEELMLDEPVQVVERPFTPIHPPEDDAERTIGEPAPILRPRELEPSTASADVEEPGSEPDSWSLGRIFVVLVLGLGLLVAAALAGWLLSQRMARNAVMDEALDAVAAQDLSGLQQIEAQLASRVGLNPEDATANASYALVELVIWQEYTGDLSRLEQASKAGAIAARTGGEGRSVALVYAYKALAQGNLESAETNLTAVREIPEGEHLRSELALAKGELDLARTHADRAVELAPEAPRYSLALARVCVAQSDARCSQQALAQAEKQGGGPEVALLALQQATASDAPSAQLLAVQGFLEDPDLSARVHSQAQIWRAELLARSGKATEAAVTVQEGLGRDPDNPELLLNLAALQASQGQHREALASLERASASRPLDFRIQGARLQVLLELDRVMQAERLLGQLPEDPRRDTLEGLLDLFARSDAAHAMELAQRRLKLGADPVATYVLGFALGRLGLERASEVLGQAHAELRESENPFHTRLASRALAAQALFDQDLDLGRQALQGRDPLAYVLVAQLYAPKDSAYAEALYDQAVELGPENALVHYARGQYHTGKLENSSPALSSWRSYLALSPSGERAGRVRAAVSER